METTERIKHKFSYEEAVEDVTSVWKAAFDRLNKEGQKLAIEYASCLPKVDIISLMKHYDTTDATELYSKLKRLKTLRSFHDIEDGAYYVRHFYKYICPHCFKAFKRKGFCLCNI